MWCTNLGPIGFAKNGVAIYNALTGQGTDAVRYEEFDECKGHSSPSGSYHYHQFSREYITWFGCLAVHSFTSNITICILLAAIFMKLVCTCMLNLILKCDLGMACSVLSRSPLHE